MNQAELTYVLRRVEDLQDFFVMGQQTLPFLQDVFGFVRKMAPMIEEVRKSVESTSAKLPTASKQLDRVTTATEMASTEILDTVERILCRIDALEADVRARLRGLEELEAGTGAVEGPLGDLLRRLPDDPGVRALATAWAAHRRGLEGLRSFEGMLPSLALQRDDCTNIMIALQVQDITAQQLAAVNSLMLSIDEGLVGLARHFDEEARLQAGEGMHYRALDIAHDANAEYTRDGERQANADRIVNEQHSRNEQP